MRPPEDRVQHVPRYLVRVNRRE
eukprot:COSAG02_NODE_68679_length_230_cov_14.206107_1_plen_22_part_10